MAKTDKNNENGNGANNGKSIGKNIGIVCRQMNLFLNHELEEYDITASEIMFLGSLFIKDGIPQEELVKEFCIDKAAVARTLSALESKKLITRLNSDEDKRSKMVFLTEKALNYKTVLSNIQDRWYKEVMSDFEPAEMETFARVMEKITENMRSINEKK